MVRSSIPLRPPLGKTIYLFGLRIYRDTRFFNRWQGLAPLPFLTIAYEVRQYRLARSLLLRECSMHSRVFHFSWI